MSFFDRYKTTRRALLQNTAAMSALTAMGWTPKDALAAQGERKFIFFFAGGAWDTTAVFDPHHESDYVDMDEDTYQETLGNVRFTAGANRDSVWRFFDRWGHSAAVVNGIDAHSVGHDSGTQLTLTGTSASSYPDWPTLIAARGAGDYPLPHLVFSGPNFSGTYGGSVVRAGGGTLLDLIDGSLVTASDQPAPQLTSVSDSIVDAFVHERVARYANAHNGVAGLDRNRVESLLASAERAMELEGRRFEAGLDDLGNSTLDQAIKAAEMIALGLSRTAMIRIPGGWDSHGDNDVQAPQFDAFFAVLDELMEKLAVTPGLATPWLIDEVTIVCMSEFGRTPLWNASGGKDHWPYNSALIAGSGVNGGTFGASDDGLVGLPIDFASGLEKDTGDLLGSENVGTAILSLAGIDPASHLPGVQVFDALLR